MTEGTRPGVEEFEAAGLYDPDAPNADGKLALLEYLVSIGATIEDFALVGENELPSLASVVGLFPNRERITLDEAARRADVTPEFVRSVWRAAGFSVPEDGDAQLTGLDIQLFEGLSASVDFFGEDNTLQFIRVLGASAARVADAAISTFVSHAVPGSVERDPTLVELARLNAEATALLPSVITGFDQLLRYHLHALRRFGDIAVEGLDVQLRSIGFADLVGSTGLSAALTPRALVDVLTEFEVTASDISSSHGGRVVKLIGDEVMFVTNEPLAATEIGLTLIEAFAEHNVLPPVRVGVATGQVVSRDGDFAGTVVNVAARAVGVARPSSLLVDETTCDALDPERFRTRSAGAFSLKGFNERVPLIRVRRRV
ncbi:MAG TPA: adenylate/guanylate cyclase domain-containing protein [Acidimicrobiia bacterium]|nr:adenylate/guanylate cyclase domain-containing protein [Acidimicrobiia bacterium]